MLYFKNISTFIYFIRLQVNLKHSEFEFSTEVVSKGIFDFQTYDIYMYGVREGGVCMWGGGVW